MIELFQALWLAFNNSLCVTLHESTGSDATVSVDLARDVMAKNSVTAPEPSHSVNEKLPLAYETIESTRSREESALAELYPHETSQPIDVQGR